jgi:hypothetical protein
VQHAGPLRVQVPGLQFVPLAAAAREHVAQLEATFRRHPADLLAYCCCTADSSRRA